MKSQRVENIKENNYEFKKRTIFHLNEVDTKYKNRLSELESELGNNKQPDNETVVSNPTIYTKDEAYYSKLNEEKEKTLNVLEAIMVYRYYLDNDLYEESETNKVNVLKTRFANFIKKHNVVSEYLIRKNLFNIDAFIKYIDRLYNKSIQTDNSDDHYLKAQAQYFSYLSKAVQPGSNKSVIKKRTKEIYGELKKTEEETKSFVEKIKTDYTENKQKLYKEKRKELISIIKDEINEQSL